jgi:hypothetical protein
MQRDIPTRFVASGFIHELVFQCPVSSVQCPMGEMEFISGRRGLQGEEIVKSTLFCKVHDVPNSDIK